MSRPRFLLLLSAIVLTFLSPSASIAATHLVIFSGQSNMGAVKPEAAFLPEIRSLLPDAEVLHFKVAVSGEPIRYWLPEWDALAADHGLTARNDKGPIYYQQILAEFNALKRAHPKIDSITLCWMQGERDAKTGLASAYEHALSQFIANLRRDLPRPDLAIVIGRLSDHRPGDDLQSGWDTVRAVQLRVATRDPLAAWVDTDDLNDKLLPDGTPDDDLHYTAEGYLTFGRRLARQTARLILGQSPDPTGRPE